MNKGTRIRIESMENGGWLVQKLDSTANPPKVISKRYVTTTDVAGLFHKTTTFDTCFLDKKIVRYARSAEKDIWTLIVPGMVRPVIHSSYDDDDNGMRTTAAWMPPSLWIIRAPVGSSRKWDAHMCLINPTTSATGRYPSPNVYPGGNICWGRTLDTRPPMTFPRDCDKVINIFFGSEFNTDLWMHNISFSKVVKAMSTKKVIEDMTNEERFEKLLEVLPTIQLDSNMDKFYRRIVKGGSEDEPEFWERTYET